MKPMKFESLMDRDGSVHLERVIYPKYGSAKIDGNRLYVEDGQAKASSGKPTKNAYIREYLSKPEFDGLDGEVVVGSPTAKDVRRRTSSGVSTLFGEPDFTFLVFDDRTNPNLAFMQRLENAADRVNAFDDKRIKLVPHLRISDISDLLGFESKLLEVGWEGIMLRDPLAPYKAGKTTVRENWGFKLKRFEDGEAVIIGSYERMHNDNEATTNELGGTSRSSHVGNKRPAGDLGGLEVRDVKTGVEFSVGTGFDAAVRVVLWNERETLEGRIITYKHFPIGAKDKPNLPSFVAFRDEDDIS